jgi:tryptophanase
VSDVPPSSILHAAWEQCGLSHDQLWVDYVGVGGACTPQTMGALLSGDEPLGRRQYDFLAQALNERYMDLGMNHPVPYFDELP